MTGHEETTGRVEGQGLMDQEVMGLAPRVDEISVTRLALWCMPAYGFGIRLSYGNRMITRPALSYGDRMIT